MQRLHIHIGVKNLARANEFYSRLFGQPASVLKDDYAKWRLDEPAVNFAISSRTRRGVNHLGIEADTAEQLGDLRQRLGDSGLDVHNEGQTTCCYANSDKSWLRDPEGNGWEIFTTTSQSEDNEFDYPKPDADTSGCCRIKKAIACCI